MLCRSGSRRATSWACAASPTANHSSLRRPALLRPLSSSSSSSSSSTVSTSPTHLSINNQRQPLTSPTTIRLKGQRRSLSSSSNALKPTSPHGSTISLDSQRRILQRCDELQSYLQVRKEERQEGGRSLSFILSKRPLLASPLKSTTPSLPFLPPLSSSPSMTDCAAPWKSAATRPPCSRLFFCWATTAAARVHLSTTSASGRFRQRASRLPTTASPLLRPALVILTRTGLQLSEILTWALRVCGILALI